MGAKVDIAKKRVDLKIEEALFCLRKLDGWIGASRNFSHASPTYLWHRREAKDFF